jgi:hypothetical protein
VVEIRESLFNDYSLFDMHLNNIAEIKVTTDINPDLYMAVLWEASKEKSTVIIDNKIICLFGVMQPNIVWLFFSKKVTELPLSFFKKSREVVRGIIKKYKNVEGMIYSENTFSLKWAKFIGWEIDPPVPCGKKGELFYKFHGKEE